MCLNSSLLLISLIIVLNQPNYQEKKCRNIAIRHRLYFVLSESYHMKLVNALNHHSNYNIGTITRFFISSPEPTVVILIESPTFNGNGVHEPP